MQLSDIVTIGNNYGVASNRNSGYTDDVEIWTEAIYNPTGHSVGERVFHPKPRFANNSLSKKNGKYTDEFINVMIKHSGYIPVATEDEFYNLVNSSARIMGAGTRWEGTYITGQDKKYIQIKDLDFLGYGNNLFKNSWTGVYDGNNKLLDNITLGGGTYSALFSACPSNSSLRNIIAKITNISTSGLNGFVSTVTGGIVQNCFIDVTLSTTSTNVGGFCSQISSGGIYNCGVSGTISGYGSTGGFVRTVSGGEVINCYSDVDVTCINGSYAGSFVANMTGGIVSKCYSTGNVIQTLIANGYYIGGFCGYQSAGVISDCYSTGNVSGDTGFSNYCGGFTGRNVGATIIYCYSIGTVVGFSNLGGFAGAATGTNTANYYDSTITGRSDTIGATPKTTTEMKEGTIPDTTIYVGWSATIWNANTSVDYPTLRLPKKDSLN